ncbi:MAG: hypothetical protein IOD12_15035 [Silvanigrellales bacterium]|jgi:hypothetical protein|nr:hypothetical protein [Silvanigrellales bacterium]
MSLNGSDEKRELSLEDIIQLANRIGLEFVDKRKDAERLELLRTSVRARLMNDIESAGETEGTKAIPEARLKRLAEAHPEYIDLLDRIAVSRAESEKLRIRYESYRNLFEARRTMISFKKTEMKTL